MYTLYTIVFPRVLYKYAYFTYTQPPHTPPHPHINPHTPTYTPTYPYINI